MAKLIFSTVALFVVIGSVLVEAQNQLPNYQLPSQLPNMQLPMNAQNLLTNQQGNGLLDTIRQIPSRGIQMLSSALSNVRNMFGGLGRNGYGMNNQYNNMLPQQQQQQQQGALNLPNLPNLNSLTNPLNQALQGLPNPNQLTNGLNGLTSSLTNGLNNLIPNAGPVATI